MLTIPNEKSSGVALKIVESVKKKAAIRMIQAIFHGKRRIFFKIAKKKGDFLKIFIA